MPKTKTPIKTKEKSEPRSPVVVILGHIDAGKTTLLAKIRQSQMPKEAGQITQRIGAYEVATKQGRKITFLDTPGHEAFEKMRCHGAQVADIAVLVVAADQGVQAQTKEAISHIKKAGLPMVAVINKIDIKEGSSAKAKSELIKAGVKLEEQGGEVPVVEVSAKTGQGIEELLEIIVLVAELKELKFQPTGPASGFVIASSRDPRQGPKATLLIREGTLRPGDIIVVGKIFGKIRSLRNWQGQTLESATASDPVEVLGLPEVVPVGESFQTAESRQAASDLVGSIQSVRELLADQTGLTPETASKQLNLVVKADDPSSLEAVLKELADKFKSEEVSLKIVKKGVGPISASDVELASAIEPALVIGFNVGKGAGLETLLRQSQVAVKTFQTIYDLTDAIKAALQGLLEPRVEKEMLGELEVLKVFRKEKDRMIIGGRVIQGELKPGLKVEIIRESELIGQGELARLQMGKQEVARVEAGSETGALFKGEVFIKPGDFLRAFQEKVIKLTI
jgi:translation initiation factor IF-2